VTFWDSSAVVPLLVEEPASSDIRRLAQTYGPPVVWWGTLVECSSALARRSRFAATLSSEQRRATSRLADLVALWTEIQPGEILRERALRLVAAHDLRAADALQLAAALVWAEERPAGRIYICLDARLREAARLDGFTVLPED
jgi:predicted nucleic acid-binding protein